MKYWSIVSYIFGKPLLASIIVGVGIHGMMALNLYFYSGESHWEQIVHNFMASAVFGMIQVSIPFLIPLLVTSIGRKIRVDAEIRSLQKFPHANPNLVFKLNRNGEVQFMNQAATRLLNQLGIPESKVAALLPEDTPALIDKIVGSNEALSLDHRIGDEQYEFQFKAFTDEQAIFISARNITARHDLEIELRHTTEHIGEITNFVDATFADLDPLNFHDKKYYRRMIDLLLRDEHDDHFDKPIYCFLAFTNPDGTLAGRIYHKQGDVTVEIPELIRVKPDDTSVAITFGKEEVVWCNWEDEATTLDDFQNLFHPQVRKLVGTIERFATYISNDVALIAFYKGRNVTELNAKVLKTLTVYAQSLKIISDRVHDTEDAFIYSVGALARASEANDEDTGQHIVRVNKYSRALAEAMNLDAEFCRKIHYTAQMHDVGKVHIHPDILKKPGSLDADEKKIMEEHPKIGGHILGNSPRLKMAKQIALGHHEKYDGTGYPAGLSGEDIPLAARIVTIVDVYDALRQKRSYKPAYPHQKAIDIITKGDGRVSPIHFDPKVLKAFTGIESQIEQIFETYKDEH